MRTVDGLLGHLFSWIHKHPEESNTVKQVVERHLLFHPEDAPFVQENIEIISKKLFSKISRRGYSRNDSKSVQIRHRKVQESARSSRDACGSATKTLS